MLTVEKIGGTSMSMFREVMNNVIIGSRKAGDYYNRIMVVSAYNNVTNWLLEHKKTKEPGAYQKFASGGDYTSALDDILIKLLEINKNYEETGLDLKTAEHFIVNRINQAKNYLSSLSDVLATGYINRQNILLAAREILASIGEAHSAFNSVNILKNNNINALFVDLCGFNDAEYLTIDERIHKALSRINFAEVLPVVTGYTKGTEGIMREFDRGYSEVTFSKIAVEVNASEAVVYKEFHLSSADPNIVGVEKSTPVGFTNYNVADQLADIGMEALHPKASKPIEVAGINIRIKNTFEPEHPGTLISKDYISTEKKVEIVTGSDKLVAVEVHDPLMVGEVGFDLAIMQFLRKYNLSYITKSTNANSITFVVWQDDLNHELIDELKGIYYQVRLVDVCLVCILGTNIARPGILASAAQSLANAGINILGVSQSISQVSIQFILDRQSYNAAIILLNDALCYTE